jgi:hypothetical protein
MSLGAILRNLEYGFEHSEVAFTNAAEVAERLISRCEEDGMDPFHMIMNSVDECEYLSQKETLRFYSINGIFSNIVNDSIFKKAIKWESRYEDAIFAVFSNSSSSEQRALLAMRGSFTVYLLLFLNNRGFEIDMSTTIVEHFEMYYQILDEYWRTLWSSTLESQIHLLAGALLESEYYPLRPARLNAWLDFLDVSKDTVYTEGAIGKWAGGNNEDAFFNPPKMRLARLQACEFSDLGDLIISMR